MQLKEHITGLIVSEAHAACQEIDTSLVMIPNGSGVRHTRNRDSNFEGVMGNKNG